MRHDRRERNLRITRMSEVRWYKGKYRVEVLKKSKRNWLVRLLDNEITVSDAELPYIKDGELEFITVPRLLWKKPRK